MQIVEYFVVMLLIHTTHSSYCDLAYCMEVVCDTVVVFLFPLVLILIIDISWLACGACVGDIGHVWGMWGMCGTCDGSHVYGSRLHTSVLVSMSDSSKCAPAQPTEFH